MPAEVADLLQPLAPEQAMLEGGQHNLRERRARTMATPAPNAHQAAQPSPRGQRLLTTSMKTE